MTIVFNDWGTVTTLRPCPHDDCDCWLWSFQPKANPGVWIVLHAPRDASDKELIETIERAT